MLLTCTAHGSRVVERCNGPVLDHSCQRFDQSMVIIYHQNGRRGSLRFSNIAAIHVLALGMRMSYWLRLIGNLVHTGRFAVAEKPFQCLLISDIRLGPVLFRYRDDSAPERWIWRENCRVC